MSEIKNIAEAIRSFQSEMMPIPKNTENTYFKSKYADLAEIVKKTFPIMTKNGLAVVQIPGTSESGETTLTTMIIHSESGESLTGTMRLAPVKNEPQAQGSGITYARRYALFAMLGIVAEGEDDDGNSANKASTKGGAGLENRAQAIGKTATDKTTVKPWVKGLHIQASQIAKSIDYDAELICQAAVSMATDGRTTHTSEIANVKEANLAAEEIARVGRGEKNIEIYFDADGSEHYRFVVEEF
jgi:hypothetical protein